jgi:protein ImuB
VPPQGLPFALVESGPKGLRLFAVNGVARQFGLSRGQRLADARAAVPDLLTEQHEAEKDVASLIGLCRWLERYSPWVAVDGSDGALLDVTGVAHLFGGEEAMRDDMVARLLGHGFTGQVAVEGTIGAAWGVARYGKEAPSVLRTAPPTSWGSAADKAPAMVDGKSKPQNSRSPNLLGELSEGLRGIEALPIEALRIDGDAVRTLRRLGLKTVGALMALPRASLARRFRGEMIHENVLLRLDEMLGHRQEVLNPLNPPTSFIAHRALMEPVITHEGLEAVLRGLAQALARDLEAQGQGALRLILKLFRVDGSRVQVPMGLSAPSHDGVHLLRLLLPKLESLDAGFGIDAMTLEARETGAVGHQQYGFMEDTAGKSLEELNDRVMSRQEKSFARLQKVESHVPERAEVEETSPTVRLRQGYGGRSPLSRGEGKKKQKNLPLSPGEGGPARHALVGEVSSRPLMIFERAEPARVIASVPDGPPMRLTWRRVTRKIVRSAGPERIAPEWWRAASGGRARDYYRIEDEAGRRYWIYREGLYGEDVEPKWFVHGLSA